MSGGQCKKCQQIKAGIRGQESDLRNLFYRAEARPSLVQTIPAVKEKLQALKANLQHHEHDEHGGELPRVPYVPLEDSTPDHGTYERYRKYRCRCVDCMESNNARSRDYYHRTKAVAGGTP